MDRRRRQIRDLNVFILAGLVIIAADQSILWALHLNGWIKIWGIARTLTSLAFFWFVFRRVHTHSINEIERNRQETAIGLHKERQQSEKLTMAGTLAASIAHEIRNPLTSLKGFVQLSQATSKNHSEIMLAEIDRINDIVNELLILAKPQGGEQVRKKLRTLLQSVLTLVNPQAILLNVQLLDLYPPHLDSLEVLCVENKLKQVFLNVIKNAIEAMPDGGTVAVEVSADEEWVYVEVADSGPGIAQEQLQRIGQPFSSTKEKGTGLGLMVSQTILDNHGGHMSFRNRSAGGAVVAVKLPINREGG
ncbi:ATP-binding protein [Cohnella fermenti]|uniref:histidine kinase n=1 Tax=Cohnella fermenti TaxID=2565925 RepID=A0A4S4C8W4_9BACL|nr:ATP-binding protein [Cohnella fermenti]THF84461.1 two-component sensor histidine kinase [Cohnella fermenti]